jgi:hypothetical protein
LSLLLTRSVQVLPLLLCLVLLLQLPWQGRQVLALLLSQVLRAQQVETLLLLLLRLLLA